MTTTLPLIDCARAQVAPGILEVDAAVKDAQGNDAGVCGRVCVCLQAEEAT